MHAHRREQVQNIPSDSIDALKARHRLEGITDVQIPAWLRHGYSGWIRGVGNRSLWLVLVATVSQYRYDLSSKSGSYPIIACWLSYTYVPYQYKCVLIITQIYLAIYVLWQHTKHLFYSFHIRWYTSQVPFVVEIIPRHPYRPTQPPNRLSIIEPLAVIPSRPHPSQCQHSWSRIETVAGEVLVALHRNMYVTRPSCVQHSTGSTSQLSKVQYVLYMVKKWQCPCML